MENIDFLKKLLQLRKPLSKVFTLYSEAFLLFNCTLLANFLKLDYTTSENPEKQKDINMLFDPLKDKDKIIAVIEIFYPDAKIYLFGSYARGDINSSSDVDIAIDNEKAIDLINPQRIREILSILPFPQNFDIVDFHRIPSQLKENIIKDRIIWKN